jgi:hypothetical protein
MRASSTPTTNRLPIPVEIDHAVPVGEIHVRTDGETVGKIVNIGRSTVPTFRGQPITRGWWWLRFSDGPGPRYWDGAFWISGRHFAGAEDYAEYPIIGAAVPPAEAADSAGMLAKNG